MAKGTRLLKIFVVEKPLAYTPPFQELKAKGHEVQHTLGEGESLSDYDVVFGEVCWHMTPDHLEYLDGAIKAARKAKYG